MTWRELQDLVAAERIHAETLLERLEWAGRGAPVHVVCAPHPARDAGAAASRPAPLSTAQTRRAAVEPPAPDLAPEETL